MIKINGVKASVIESQTEKMKTTPSMNQVLEKMENNFQNRNNVNFQKYNSNNSSVFDNNIFNANNLNNSQQNQNNVSTLSNFQNGFDNSNAQSLGGMFGDDNLLLSILPILLSNKKTNVLSSNVLIKELLKKSPNPMFQKIFELLPKLSKNDSTDYENDRMNDRKKSKKQEVKIDSLVRTDEFENDEIENCEVVNNNIVN